MTARSPSCPRQCFASLPVPRSRRRVRPSRHRPPLPSLAEQRRPDSRGRARQPELHEGENRDAGPRRRLALGVQERVRGAHGPFRLRQVHPAPDNRGPHQGQLRRREVPRTGDHTSRVHELAMIFQNFVLLPWKTSLDNVMFGLSSRNDLSDEEKRRRRHGGARQRGARRVRERLPRRALGRDEAEGRDRAGPGAPASGPAHGRAVQRARQPDRRPAAAGRSTRSS